MTAKAERTAVYQQLRHSVVRGPMCCVLCGSTGGSRTVFDPAGPGDLVLQNVRVRMVGAITEADEDDLI